MTANRKEQHCFLLADDSIRTSRGVVLGFIREEVFSLFLHTGGLRVVGPLRGLAGVRSKTCSLQKRRFVSMNRRVYPRHHG